MWFKWRMISVISKPSFRKTPHLPSRQWEIKGFQSSWFFSHIFSKPHGRSYLSVTPKIHLTNRKIITYFHPSLRSIQEEHSDSSGSIKKFQAYLSIKCLFPDKVMRKHYISHSTLFILKNKPLAQWGEKNTPKKLKTKVLAKVHRWLICTCWSSNFISWAQWNRANSASQTAVRTQTMEHYLTECGDIMIIIVVKINQMIILS